MHQCTRTLKFLLPAVIRAVILAPCSSSFSSGFHKPFAEKRGDEHLGTRQRCRIYGCPIGRRPQIYLMNTLAIVAFLREKVGSLQDISSERLQQLVEGSRAGS